MRRLVGCLLTLLIGWLLLLAVALGLLELAELVASVVLSLLNA